MNVFSALVSLIVLNSAHKGALQNVEANRKTTIPFMVQKWLNYEWMPTWDVDVEPFNETTFPYFVPVSELILESNH